MVRQVLGQLEKAEAATATAAPASVVGQGLHAAGVHGGGPEAVAGSGRCAWGARGSIRGA